VGKGTGLGLATVYGVVRGHQGHIQCQSVPGGGTVFTVYLPFSRAVDVPGPRDPGAANPGGGHGERVLLVDDEEALRQLGGRMLAMGGYAVTLAASGEEALEMAAAGPRRFDLVVMDLGMPGMGGEAAALKLAELKPDLPLFVASGYPVDSQNKPGLFAVAAGFLAKPFRKDELLAAVARVLGAGGKVEQ